MTTLTWPRVPRSFGWDLTQVSPARQRLHVWDVDNNAYIDLVMGVGTLSLGYCDETVDKAIGAQLEQGINFSLMHPLEVEVAELIGQLVPGAEIT